jgi:hypothetical protein
MNAKAHQSSQKNWSNRDKTLSPVMRQVGESATSLGFIKSTLGVVKVFSIAAIDYASAPKIPPVKSEPLFDRLTEDDEEHRKTIDQEHADTWTMSTKGGHPPGDSREKRPELFLLLRIIITRSWEKGARGDRRTEKRQDFSAIVDGPITGLN